MKLDQDGRRTVAQFLNGIGVATVGALVLAPLASGTPRLELAIAGVIWTLVCHALALFLGRRRD